MTEKDFEEFLKSKSPRDVKHTIFSLFCLLPITYWDSYIDEGMYAITFESDLTLLRSLENHIIGIGRKIQLGFTHTGKVVYTLSVDEKHMIKFACVLKYKICKAIVIGYNKVLEKESLDILNYNI